MLTEGLLGAILASQWIIAKKSGVTMDEFVKGLGQNFLLPSSMNPEITPFSRVTLDLTNARKLSDLSIAGLWVMVESCTGTDIQAYVNKNSLPLPVPILLDKIDKFYFPFQHLYITHAAQPGKEITLLIGRATAEVFHSYSVDIASVVNAIVASTLALIAGMPVIPAYPTVPTYKEIRWGINREPTWVNGAFAVAPGAGVALVTKAVTAAMLGRVFGLHISSDEANQFDLKLAGAPVNHYVMASGGTIDLVFASPIRDAIAAGTSITINVVVAGTGANAYQASLLYDEA
jgi:hypothetical protein